MQFSRIIMSAEIVLLEVIRPFILFLFFAKSLSPENFYARIGPLLRTIINGYPDT